METPHIYYNWMQLLYNNSIWNMACMMCVVVVGALWMSCCGSGQTVSCCLFLAWFRVKHSVTHQHWLQSADVIFYCTNIHTAQHVLVALCYILLVLDSNSTRGLSTVWMSEVLYKKNVKRQRRSDCLANGPYTCVKLHPDVRIALCSVSYLPIWHLHSSPICGSND